MNMSYCRFSNTSNDLHACVENLRTLDPEDRHPNTDAERAARARIIRLAADLLCEIGVDDPGDSHAIDAIIRDLDASCDPVEDEYSEERYAHN